MTKEQERVLAQIEANDPHPDRGEIKFATDRIAGDYYERTSYKNGRQSVNLNHVNYKYTIYVYYRI